MDIQPGRSTRVREPSTLSIDEQRWLDFALRWAGFSSGDEFIFQEFGLAPAAYYRRVLHLINGAAAGAMSKQQRLALRSFCVRKLAAIHVSSPQITASETTLAPQRWTPSKLDVQQRRPRC